MIYAARPRNDKAWSVGHSKVQGTQIEGTFDLFVLIKVACFE
jgi:hypothetical protein